MTCGMIYRPLTHHYIVLVLEFINWAMFLAVWIAISANIGKHQECVAPSGGHDHSRPCNTAYTALAFAIVDWILFTISFVAVGYAISAGKEVVPVYEKNVSASGPAVRPSDDNTLRGESAA